MGGAVEAVQKGFLPANVGRTQKTGRSQLGAGATAS